MRMEGFSAGVVGGLGELTKGFLPKLLVASPVVFHEYVLVADSTPVVALTIIIVLDWFLGTVRAIKRKNLSSRAMVSGLGKVFAYMILIFAVNQAAVASSALYFLPWLTYTYIGLTEITSLIENINALGVKLPLVRYIYKFLTRNNLGDGKKSMLEDLFIDMKSKITKKQDKKDTAKIKKARTKRMESLDDGTLTVLLDEVKKELERRDNQGNV